MLSMNVWTKKSTTYCVKTPLTGYIFSGCGPPSCSTGVHVNNHFIEHIQYKTYVITVTVIQ